MRRVKECRAYSSYGGLYACQHSTSFLNSIHVAEAFVSHFVIHLLYWELWHVMFLVILFQQQSGWLTIFWFLSILSRYLGCITFTFAASDSSSLSFKVCPHVCIRPLPPICTIAVVPLTQILLNNVVSNIAIYCAIF